ncbi:MAG: hypothetical protein ACSHX8_15250 [Opitutaceae bacterium]
MIVSKNHVFCLVFITSALLSSASANVIFSEDFESETKIGAAPSKASAVRPKENAKGNIVMVVGSKHNLAGSGNAVYLQDKKTDASISLEFDIVDSTESQVSALQIDFSFAKSGINETKNSKLYFGAGEYSGENSSKMNSKSRRYLHLEFIDSDEIKINSESGKDKTVTINQNIQNKLSIFVNDYDNKDIKYSAPRTGEKTTLEPNTIACYMNGYHIHTTTLDLDDPTQTGTVGSSENNFGRIGFYSDTKSDNNGWMFDDFKVTAL